MTNSSSSTPLLSWSIFMMALRSGGLRTNSARFSCAVRFELSLSIHPINAASQLTETTMCKHAKSFAAGVVIATSP